MLEPMTALGRHQLRFLIMLHGVENVQHTVAALSQNLPSPAVAIPEAIVEQQSPMAERTAAVISLIE